MKYKLDTLQKELEGAPILLQVVCHMFEEFSKDNFGIEPTITRVLGKIDGDSGVHDDYRAVDIRDEYAGGFVYTEDQRSQLLHEINTTFYRNDGKETMIWHSFQGQPHHFHLQIATLTKTYMKK